MLKKLFIFPLLFLLFSSALHANHIVAISALTWEPTAHPDYYKFKLALIRDCSGTAIPGQLVINGPMGSFNLFHNASQNENIYMDCDSSTCASGNGYERAYYINDSVHLPGVPPPSGWTFSHSMCCRLNSVNTSATGSFYTESTMFPVNNAKPKFSTLEVLDVREPLRLPTQGTNSLSLGVNFGILVDSVRYDLAPNMQSANTPVNYNPGFSVSAPLPDNSEFPSNGANQFNSTTGTFNYDIDTATPGLYYYALDYNYYSNGQLGAKIRREFAGFVSSNDSVTNPNAPTISTTVKGTAYNHGDHVKATYHVGDTIRITISSYDSDIDPGGAFQKITAYKTGPVFSANNQPGYSSAQLTSLNPGGTFTRALTNNVMVYWVPRIANLTSPIYHFNVRMQDNACAGARSSNLDFTLTLTPTANIIDPIGDTLDLCLRSNRRIEALTSSDSVIWQPAGWVNNPHSLQPTVITNQSGWLYCTDGLNPNFRDSVYISNSQYSLVLSLNGNTAVLNDTAGLQNKTWFLNGIPLSHSSDSLAINLHGTYYVKGTYNGCDIISNSIHFQSTRRFALSNNILSKSRQPQRLDSIYRIDFTFNDLNLSTDVYNLKYLYVYGSANGSGSVGLTIYNASQNVLWTDSRNVSSGGGMHIFQPDLRFSEADAFTLKISATNGLEFWVYQSVKPSVRIGGLGGQVEINALKAGVPGNFPNLNTSTMPAIGAVFESTIGINEKALVELGFYPNPVSDWLHLEKPAQGGEAFKLFSPNGQVVLQKQLSRGQQRIDLSELSMGLYILEYEANRARLLVR